MVEAHRHAQPEAGAAMTDTVDDLRTAIVKGLVRSHDELAEARRRQRHKDSTGNRAAVATCLTNVDALLDTYLAADSPRR
jgi:hypothetical protein